MANFKIYTFLAIIFSYTILIQAMALNPIIRDEVVKEYYKHLQDPSKVEPSPSLMNVLTKAFALVSASPREIASENVDEQVIPVNNRI